MRRAGDLDGVQEGRAAGCSCVLVIISAAVLVGLVLGYCAP